MDEIGASFRRRVPYEPIHRRRPLKLPGDARVAVWTIVNVENWSPAGPMPRAVLPPPMGQPLLPDLPNWAWHEYGMRVGFWRFIEVLGERGIKATFAVNGTACRVYEEACAAAREAGWEFMGHGFVQRPMHKVDDQRRAIAETISAIKDFTGKPPRGWESPGLTETDETIDLLAEAASNTSPTGCSTSSRCRSGREPARSSRFPIRSRSTTSSSAPCSSSPRTRSCAAAATISIASTATAPRRRA